MPMPSAAHFASIDPKIAATIASAESTWNHPRGPTGPLASLPPSPAVPPSVSSAAPMAFRSRGQPLPSRSHLLDFNRQHDKNNNGMVNRLRTRISSWKLLSRRSKTHTNLASLCLDTGYDAAHQAQEHRGMPRTCTAADIKMLSNDCLRQDTQPPCYRETSTDGGAHGVPQATTSIADCDPFADEDMFNTSLNSILRTEPDLLGSSTPRRGLSVLDPNLATVRRQSVSKVEKRSSLVKQESGLNREFFARMRSSSDLEKLVPFEIPERRSSIVCFDRSLKKQMEELMSGQTAKDDLHAPTGKEIKQPCKDGYISPRTPSRRSSVCLPRRSSTAQDLSRLCCKRLSQCPRHSSPRKRAPQLQHTLKNHEVRSSLPPSPARSDVSKAPSSCSVSEKADEPRVEINQSGRPPQDDGNEPRVLALSPSVPLLVATPPSDTDLGDTVYRCFPVEQGKKHPSPTKLEWEDIKQKWQVGVRVHTNELYI